jgi:sulfhydrogenase subunit beta (sulfur reductase)
MEGATASMWAMTPRDLVAMVDALCAAFDEVLAPVFADGVIRLRPIDSADELPIGVTDRHDPGSYRATATGGSRRFSYAVGPDSLKAIVHPPRSPVWSMTRDDAGNVAVSVAPTRPVRRAVLGARACDLAALDRLGRTQLDGPHPDLHHATARAELFLIGIDCSRPAPTCFCESTGTGPYIDGGADLSITELDDDEGGDNGVHYVVRAGSERGRVFAESLGLQAATHEGIADAERARRSVHTAERSMPADAATIVLDDLEHSRWDDAAERCLSCGNCTAVCPTCFCTDLEDRIELDGTTARRDRVWDTCFSLEYSHLGPGPARSSPRSRYRQWLTHKLGTWHDQFGESGCVGCGRCITWCPVGIDLTVEVDALASSGAPS